MSHDNESNKLKESKQISETRTHVELYDGHIGDEDVMSGDATFAKFSDITETHRRHAWHQRLRSINTRSSFNTSADLPQI